MSTVEAETLPAGILRGLVRERIERLMPSNVLLILKEAERIERKDIAARLRGKPFGHDDDPPRYGTALVPARASGPSPPSVSRLS